MLPHDYYIARLERQRADIETSLADLLDAKKSGWKVLQAELKLDSLVRAYVRDMQDAPASAVAEHVAICVSFT